MTKAEPRVDEVEEKLMDLRGVGACIDIVTDGLVYGPHQYGSRASDATYFLARTVEKIADEIEGLLYYPAGRPDRKQQAVTKEADEKEAASC
jgi:hypothetical protein